MQERKRTYRKRCKESWDLQDLSSILVNQSFRNRDTQGHYPYPTFAFAVRPRKIPYVSEGIAKKRAESL